MTKKIIAISVLSLIGVVALASLNLDEWKPEALQTEQADHSGDLSPVTAKLNSQNPQSDEKNDIELSAKTTTVEIDGETFPVNLRGYPILFDNNIDQIKSLSDVYDSLLKRSEDGDILAIRTLYAGLKNCEYAPDTTDELNRVIDSMSSEGVVSLRGAGNDEREVVAADEAERSFYSSEIEKNFEFCKGISRDIKNSANNILMLGVENNDLFSMMVFTSSGDSSPVDKFEVNAKAWEVHSSIPAALALSQTYLSGVPNANGERMPPDYAMAHTYMLLGKKLSEAGANRGRLDPTMTMLSLNELDLKVSEITGFLSPADQLDAEDLAKEILNAKGDKCCIGFWFN